LKKKKKKKKKNKGLYHKKQAARHKEARLSAKIKSTALITYKKKPHMPVFFL